MRRPGVTPRRLGGYPGSSSGCTACSRQCGRPGWVAGWSLVAAPQFLALMGMGEAGADWGLRLSQPQLPDWYLAAFFGGAGLLVVAPFCYEWRRCRQAQRRGNPPDSLGALS